MADLRQAAQQALETPGCERLKDWYEIGPVQRAALETFLEAALEQPAEPVACRHEWFRTGAMQPGESRCVKCGVWSTAPQPAVSVQRTQAWVGLTEDETAACFEAKKISPRLQADAKRIEAKLREKNGGAA